MTPAPAGGPSGVPWANVRPWRNNNPLDLRCLNAPERWGGQVGIDDSPGGPFAVFADRAMGWRAGAVCLLAYQDLHGLRTVRGIIDRWAPPSDNNPTDAYVEFVAHRLGVQPDTTIDLHDGMTMLGLVTAISVEEGGAEIRWPQSEKVSGLQAAGLTGIV